MNTQEIALSKQELAAIADAFWETGYFCLPPLLPVDKVGQLARASSELRRNKIPSVYLYLFDQPWQLFAVLGKLTRHFLGEKSAVLPNLWAWHLDEPGMSGWPAHRDCDADTVFEIERDRILMSLSLWIPLTDADVRNGCMHVLPRNTSERLATDDLDPSLISSDEIVPLPAKAGSVLGWAQDIVHWGGGFTEQARNPRISLSLEFQNMSFTPLATPLIDLSRLPAFEQRLSLVRDQFAKYRHMESREIT